MDGGAVHQDTPSSAVVVAQQCFRESAPQGPQKKQALLGLLHQIGGVLAPGQVLRYVDCQEPGTQTA